MTALKINKKVVLEAVFLIGIIALTLYSIFHEQDPAAIWACLRGADIRYLIGSIFLVLAFVLGESVILWWLFRTSGQRRRHHIVVCILLSDFSSVRSHRRLPVGSRCSYIL